MEAISADQDLPLGAVHGVHLEGVVVLLRCKAPNASKRAAGSTFREKHTTPINF